jgi:hypothetical protein
VTVAAQNLSANADRTVGGNGCGAAVPLGCLRPCPFAYRRLAADAHGDQCRGGGRRQRVGGVLDFTLRRKAATDHSWRGGLSGSPRQLPFALLDRMARVEWNALMSNITN